MTTERGSRPTLRDVARAVGLHESTVSRILNGRAVAGRIPQETEERVKTIAAQLGYRGNTLARALRTGQSLIIGMVIPDIANLYQARITRGAEDALSVEGYSLVIASTDNDFEQNRRQVSAMISAQTAGILYGTARVGDAALEEIFSSGIPVVLFNRSAEEGRVAAVVPDNRAGIGMAVRHLVDLGHRRIVHVAGPVDVSSGLNRRAAFDEAMAACGLAGESEPAVKYTEEEGERAARTLLERVPAVTAIVAANDRLALGTVDAVRATGRHCPDDISIVGFNDMPYADRVSPPLTTIQVPQYDLGHRAATLLLKFLRDPSPSLTPATEHLSPRLVVRASTAPPP